MKLFTSDRFKQLHVIVFLIVQALLLGVNIFEATIFKYFQAKLSGLKNK